MDDLDLLMLWLKGALTQFPAVLVCLVFCLWTASRWRQVPFDARWALPGFGLLLALTLSGPSAQILLQRWVINHAMPLKEAQPYFTVFAFVWSSLHALAYLFLGISIFKGRSQPSSLSPPLLPPRGAPPV